MEYSIDRPTPCRVVVNATLTPDEVSEQRQHVLATWMRGANVPGFRKGKAPRLMVERNFAKEIREDLEEHLSRHVWGELLKGEKLRPATPFGIRDAAIGEGGGFTLTGELEIYPEVTLPDLAGYTPPPFDLGPAATEVDKAIEQLRERQGQWEPADDAAAADGMLVEARVHGEYPDGGGDPFDDERALFSLGAAEVRPEFDAAIPGHKVGDELTIERVLGDEATPELVGKRLVYTLTIKSLRARRLPPLDDELATAFGIDGGLAALRDKVLDRLRDEKRHLRRDVWRDALLTHLSRGEKLALPETVVEEDARKELVEFAHSLAQRGIDPEKAKLDWEKIAADMRERVSLRLGAELLLNALADSYGISVTAAEVDHQVETEARRINVPFAELKGNLAKGGGLERVAGILRREKATDQALKPYFEGA